MASKFLVPLDLSNFTNTPLANTSVGFVTVYVKNEYLKYLSPSGIEKDVVLERPLDGLSVPTLATGISSSDTLLVALSKIQASLNNIVLTGDVVGTASYSGGFLTILTTALGSGVTPQDLINWNNAYSWGDHSTAGYQLLSQKGLANGYASLDSGGKVPITQLPSAIMEYKGVWNVTTNVPVLADGTGDIGSVYRVSTSGTRNLGSGSISFEIGDYVIYNGSTWEKSDTTDAVASVNGQTGIVVLTTLNIAENTNLYFTNSRARNSISLTTTGTSGASTYDNLTGVLNIPNYATPLATTNYGLFSQIANSVPVTATLLPRTLIGVGVGSLVVNPNIFQVGDSFVAELGGFLSAKSNDNLRIIMRANGNILADSGFQNMNSVTNGVWTLTLHFTIRSIGGPGVASINTIGKFLDNKTSNQSVVGFGFSTVNNTTFDTTGANTLEIEAQWNSADPINSIYSTSFVLTKVF